MPLPGVTFQTGRRPPPPAPTRTDVAGFAGRTRRGPRVDRARAAAGEPGFVPAPVRVEEWVGFAAALGGLDPDAPLAYAARGYFESGGRVAYVARVADDTARAAAADWVPAPDDAPADAARMTAEAAGFEAPAFTITAADVGDWANGGRVLIEYVQDTPAARAAGPAGPVREPNEPADRAEPHKWPPPRPSVPGFRPAVNITVEIGGEAVEHLTGLRPEALAADVAARSALIRLVPQPAGEPGPRPARPPRPPRRMRWERTLNHGYDGAFPVAEYAAAVDALIQVPEVALLALPDVYDRLPPTEFRGLLAAVVPAVGDCHDRLLLLDPPPDEEAAAKFRGEAAPPDPAPLGAGSLVAFADAVRADAGTAALQRNVAVYHPWVRVADPLGPPSRPLRAVPPSGHVAGLIARLDRERGAAVTPANAPLYDALDLDAPLGPADAARVYAAGVNLLKAEPGRGLVVWGGRTLALGPDDRYLAHGRFVHRLVRTLRAVVDPLVHEVNGPDLWRLLERAVTVVLADAFRGGALAGDTPDQAYRVRADEGPNPEPQREGGLARCEVEVALAAPMEFITLVVTMSERGQIEVFDP